MDCKFELFLVYTADLWENSQAMSANTMEMLENMLKVNVQKIENKQISPLGLVGLYDGDVGEYEGDVGE